MILSKKFDLKLTVQHFMKYENILQKYEVIQGSLYDYPQVLPVDSKTKRANISDFAKKSNRILRPIE